MKRIFPFILMAVLSFPVAVHAAERKPNIVLILADDLGYGDVRCYNNRSKVDTPHLDQLAKRGMRFTDAHSPATVCTPSRYSLMTGQMAFRVPNGGTVFTGAGGPSLIAPDRLTLPGMLKKQGYSCAAVGKWHVGLTFRDKDGKPIHQGGIEAIRKIDYTKRIEGGPLDCGFDQFFGTACCPTTDWLYAYIDGDRIPVPPTELIDKSKLPKHPYANDCRAGMIAQGFSMEEVDNVFLKKSREFLAKHVRTSPDQPFFLYHATQAVHLPSFAGRDFQNKTKAGPHGDFIAQFDHTVGELMNDLEKLGVAENTIVIVSSDNGPEVASIVNMRKDYQHDGAYPWRGIKRDSWEGGHRVPFLVRWPGRVPENSTSDQLISLTDVMATLASITGTPLPNDAAEDSFDMLPALEGKAKSSIRPFLIAQAFRGGNTLSLRRGNWKYIDHADSGGNDYSSPALKQYALPDKEPKAPGQLYDLAKDPGETTNLYSQQPEIVAELKTLLDKIKKDGRSVVRPSTTDSHLNIDRIFGSKEFHVESVPSIHWSERSEMYFTLVPAAKGKGVDLVKHDPATGKNEVLVPVSAFIPKGSSELLNVENFKFSSDESQVLLYTNGQKVWRQKTRGDYWILNILSRELRKLGGEGRRRP